MSDHDSSFDSRILPAARVGEARRYAMPDLNAPLSIEQLAQELRCKEARSQGFEKGRAQGYDEGLAEGRRAAAQESQEQLQAENHQLGGDAAARIQSVIESFDAEFARVEAGLADQIIDLIASIAEKVVNRRLEQDESIVADIVTASLDKVRESAGQIRLRVNEAELGTLEAALSAHPLQSRIQLIAAAEIRPGGCLIETPDMLLDASVEQRWQQAMAGLGMAPDVTEPNP